MRRKGTRRFVIFTDLDGSLMNRSDYSWEPARHALERIRELGIPLIICTSRTRQEVAAIQKEMDIREPFITENGGGIFFPKGYFSHPVGSIVINGDIQCILLGKPFGSVRNFVEKAMKDFSIRGFGKMSIEEISQHTGLSPDKAALAKAREFTEIFVMEHEEELPTLELLAERNGCRITRGGRLFHCMAFGNDKGVAVERMKDIFYRAWNKRVLSIGFGDSPNDFPLLKAVDIPVLLPQEDGTFEALDLPGIIRAPHSGSRGWNEAALEIIS